MPIGVEALINCHQTKLREKKDDAPFVIIPYKGLHIALMSNKEYIDFKPQ